MGLATVATVLAVGGIALDVFGKVKAGKEQKKAATAAATQVEKRGDAERESAESQAQLADFNQEVATLQAEDALDRGAEEESRYRTQVRGMIGAQRAAFAGGNIDVSYGSSVDVQADTAFMGELDAMQIRTNAAREAWGYKVGAEDYRVRGSILRREGYNAQQGSRYEAEAIRQGGRAAQTAGYFGAASSILGGTTSLLMWRHGMRN